MSDSLGNHFSTLLRFGLPLLFVVLCACTDSGGGYSSGHYSSGYYDPWYHHGGYYYNDIYVPAYPDGNPDDLPDRGDRPRPEHPIVDPDRPRPEHPIARPDRPTTRPSIPSRARPMNSSFSRGGMSRGGMRGGRGGRR